MAHVADVDQSINLGREWKKWQTKSNRGIPIRTPRVLCHKYRRSSSMTVERGEGEKRVVRTRVLSIWTVEAGSGPPGRRQVSRGPLRFSSARPVITVMEGHTARWVDAMMSYPPCHVPSTIMPHRTGADGVSVHRTIPSRERIGCGSGEGCHRETPRRCTSASAAP